MTPTLDTIRARGEAKIEQILADADSEVRAILHAALRRYGNVAAFPQSVWDSIKRHYADNDRLTAAVVLLLVSADSLTSDAIAKQGVPASGYMAPLAEYKKLAEAQVQSLADTVDTIESRLTRRVQNQRLAGPSPPSAVSRAVNAVANAARSVVGKEPLPIAAPEETGFVGELTDKGIEKSIDDVLTPARRETIAVDQTTGALSAGQIEAAKRVAGSDGAATTMDGTKVTVQLIWRTERDNLVCPRCAPLEGQPEEVWSLVFPEGPGYDAHPNCRCYLDIRVVPAGDDE